MYIQEYNNINDIEKEFIPQLEALLCSQVPSFNYLVKEESEMSETKKYFLCFGGNDNGPKGFLKATSSENEKSKLQKLFKLSSNSTQWSGPGVSSIVLEPRFNAEIQKDLLELIKEHNKDHKSTQHQVTLDKKLDPIINQGSLVGSSELVAALFKGHKDYSSFLKSLSISFQKTVEKEFKSFSKLKIGTYKSLKECFSYKKESLEDYQELKKDPFFKSIIEEDLFFMSIENEQRILGFSCIIKGKKGHCFFTQKNLSGLINETVLLQLSVMAFYETEESLYLHPLLKTLRSSSYEASQFSFTNELSKQL